MPDKPEFVKLHNQVKHYDWGSPLWIPQLLGAENPEGRPWAELWMGTHGSSSSTVNAGQKEISLGDFIACDVRRCLGEEAARKYGGLPFLFKLLAAERPLSIQAHPSLSLAREGFSRENSEGIALDDPRRNYKDSDHKPEIICGLTPFTGMCGFREPEEIGRLLGEFLVPGNTGISASTPAAPDSLRSGMTPLLIALENQDSAAALKQFLTALFALAPDSRKQLGEYILAAGLERLAAARQAHTANAAGEFSGLSPAIWETMICLAELYPDDPAIISPLYLHLFQLRPGEAVFLPAGTLHAYIYGFGVELMANSDNVLRGGLTSKYVDAEELIKILDFTPMRPNIIVPPEAAGRYTYPAPCGEFSLAVMRGGEENETIFQTVPAICLVISGELEITGKTDRAVFKQGESVFIPHDSPGLVFRGKFTLYAASVPATSAT